MKFSELAKDLGVEVRNDFEVAGIATDSRNVKPDYVFFALKGEVADGADFLEQAVKNGAKVVYSQSPIKLNNVNITGSVSLSSGGDVLGRLDAMTKRFFSPLPEELIAVTGTNGKTSVANFTAALLSTTGKKAASIGTLGTLLDGDSDKKFSYSGLTSPDMITLMQDLSALKKKNVDAVAMETSSHGLQQHRMGGLKFKTGAFTNFTQDHLDYHKNMDEYFRAKMILFSEYIEAGGNAVLNADIPEYEKIRKICENKKLKIISYGKNGKEIKIKNIKPHDKGLDIEIEMDGKARVVNTPLIGSFQAYNVVCAMGNLLSFGSDADKIVAATGKLKPVKGRMDVIISSKQNAKIVIDYAHTPDALEKAIEGLRAHTSGKLITMFGCGGDRDKSKRKLMGKIAAEKSDMVIVTDDNPRTEDAASIRKEIMLAAKGAEEIEGRREAIAHAVSLLQSGDSLLLAGKGHEDYQIIGKEKFPFDEFKIVREILGSL